MKVLLSVVLFVAAAQAKSVADLSDLQFVHKYVTPNPRHTAEEWEAIYAAAEADTPENTTGLVLGTVPQPEDAGKAYVKHEEERIIAGTAAALGQFPWQAMIILGGTSLCGGSLISSEWVLTAAHCVQGISSFSVTLGSTSMTSHQAGAVSQAARQAVSHSGYDEKTHQNDIGVLRLSSAVALGDHINAVRLPREAQASTTFAGSAAVISGFGRISSTNNEVSGALMYASVEIIANTACARIFGSIIQAGQVCSTGANGRSPCNGDSGGPLVVREADDKYTLVGAVSFGVEDCPANFPAVYVRTSKYLAWISSNTGVAVRA
ncbi:chymotrypsinogen A-like [Bacillus rossius redtenbacheri]|uniref:chymotrypsinogen A-like n=1 Tax=Bacillus rossius redtenbacheri TaxID=93214 RepID=UPI002FDE0F84